MPPEAIGHRMAGRPRPVPCPPDRPAAGGMGCRGGRVVGAAPRQERHGDGGDPDRPLERPPGIGAVAMTPNPKVGITPAYLTNVALASRENVPVDGAETAKLSELGDYCPRRMLPYTYGPSLVRCVRCGRMLHTGGRRRDRRGQIPQPF